MLCNPAIPLLAVFSLLSVCLSHSTIKTPQHVTLTSLLFSKEWPQFQYAKHMDGHFRDQRLLWQSRCLTACHTLWYRKLILSFSSYKVWSIEVQFYFCRKKIEEIGKMTSLSQDEITTSTKTIVQGLDTLKNEHHQILNGLLSSMKTIKRENGDTNLVEEKTNRLKKSLETIELGLNEAHVSNEFHSWHGILHYIYAFHWRFGGGLGSCNPPPPFSRKIFYQKRSFFAVFRAAPPLSGPNGGQK